MPARAWGLLSSSLSKPGNFDYTLCGNFLVFKKRSLSLCGNNSPLSELSHFVINPMRGWSVKQCLGSRVVAGCLLGCYGQCLRWPLVDCAAFACAGRFGNLWGAAALSLTACLL